MSGIEKFKLKDKLKNYLYKQILDFKRSIKETSEKVYGKKVLLFDNDGVMHDYELQTWEVTVPFSEKMNIFDLIGGTQYLLENYELQKLSEIEPDKSKWGNYTLHQLCDWKYLEDEEGHIVWGDKIIFVKYAVIIKDFEEAKYE